MLNPEQELVAAHTTGPALVIAGPGSGKTRTVVHRAAHLMNQGTPPGEIALITFTKKAAREMKDRLHHLVGDRAEEVWVSTFHSLAAAILRQYDRALRVLDAEDAKAIIGNILEDLNAPKRITAKTAQGAISRVKNSGGGVEDLTRLYADMEPYLSRAFARYEEWKRDHGYLDFDDLLHEAVKALSDEDLRRTWSERCRYLTVDEYQDTNLIQFNLVRLLLTPEENLMAVGDPNQAIYSWRGADYRLILEFRKHFPHAAIYRLPTNYRSHRGITTAATTIITRNTTREDLPLQALRDGPPPTKVIAPTREAEALFVAEAVQGALNAGVPPEDIAILTRTLATTRPLEAALRRFRIPYTVVGGVGFWKRREVKLTLDFLRATTGDKVALANLIATLVPGFGPKKAAKAAEDPSLLKSNEGRYLLSRLEDLSPIAEAKGHALALTLERWLRVHRDYLELTLLDWSEGNREAAEERFLNMLEVANALQGFAETTPNGDLATFLQDILLEDEEEEETTGVKIMTLHASKGLEFHTVLITGLVEGVFPSWRSAKDPAQLEEERRLLYVGITRAKEKLYLSCYREGEKGPTYPSRFFHETPGSQVDYNPLIGYQDDETTTAVNSLATIANLDW